MTPGSEEVWPTLDDILSLIGDIEHDQQVKLRVSNRGLLESAIARSHTLYYKSLGRGWLRSFGLSQLITR